jgi:hypothetical protein
VKQTTAATRKSAGPAVVVHARQVAPVPAADGVAVDAPVTTSSNRLKALKTPETMKTDEPRNVAQKRCREPFATHSGSNAPRLGDDVKTRCLRQVLPSALPPGTLGTIPPDIGSAHQTSDTFSARSFSCTTQSITPPSSPLPDHKRLDANNFPPATLAAPHRLTINAISRPPNLICPATSVSVGPPGKSDQPLP